MHFRFICSLLLILECFCEIKGWWNSRKDCTIPKGDLYDRATFRLQYGDATSPLARGEKVEQYNRVVVVCDKDILADLIIQYHVITCHRGKWKPKMPGCRGPMSCAHLEPVANAISEVLLGNDVDYPHGTVVRYHCRKGYILNGPNERHCKNGIWDDIKFNCTRKPEGPKKCKNLEPVENAIPEVILGNSTEYLHGTVVRYRCREGYTLAGHNERQCQNGIWENVKFKCIRDEELRERRCPQITIQNGPVIPITLSGKYSVTCHEGFEVRGNDIISCDNGVWSQPLPECVPKSCDPLQDTIEMVNSIGSVNRIEHGSIVRLQCRWSWVPKDGVREATCVNGEWKPKQPVCIVFCKLPRKGNRYFTYWESGSPVVTSKVANHMKVTQHCRTGSKKSTSTCVNGRWRPSFQYCPYGQRQFRTLVDNCTIPDTFTAMYINSSSIAIDVTEEVAHGDKIMQVCRGDSGDVAFSESKSSHCYGGRWFPEFQNCTNICGGRKLVIEATDMSFPDKSQVDVENVGFVNSVEECAVNCVYPANVSCRSIQVYTFVHDGLSELYCKLLSERADNTSDKFIAYDGSKSNIYNVQCDSANFIDNADGTVCKRPDIEFSILSPDLEEYYASEVVNVHCHTRDGSVNENITCLAMGEWSKSNITCEAIEDEIHCHPPRKSHMVYWPIKELYNVNDTLGVLTCGVGLIPAGSLQMRCIANETWEGDFECLSPCENGKPVILATKAHFPIHSKMDVEVIGYVSGAKECARNCVEYANFSCKAIQVYVKVGKGEIQFYCKLLSEMADNGSDKFIERHSRGSDVYNIQCETSCQVPAEDEVSFTDVNGQTIKANKTLPNGTILKIECIKKQGYKKQRTATCIAGKWSGPISHC